MTRQSGDELLFVGLGTMGRPIALRLLREGHPVHIYDRDSQAGTELLSAGAMHAPAERLARLDYGTIITCLPSAAVTEDFFATCAPLHDGTERAVLDLATVSPSFARKMFATLSEKGIDYLDTPVAGGERGAISGKLVVMVSGAATAFARARPQLEKIGEPVLYFGETAGSASRMKAINQFIYLTYNATFAAGLSIAEEAGLPVEAVLTVLRSGAARHELIEDRLDRVIASQGERGFPIHRCLKDINCLEWTPKDALAAGLLRTVREALEAGDRDCPDMDILSLGPLPLA
jgi:2-hydroxy-3-oxopropionate reductase